jgi:hypothetical protein
MRVFVDVLFVAPPLMLLPAFLGVVAGTVLDIPAFGGLEPVLLAVGVANVMEIWILAANVGLRFGLSGSTRSRPGSGLVSLCASPFSERSSTI